jgi:transglutaminase-like putative cysteine protease
MNRREFLASSIAISAASALPIGSVRGAPAPASQAAEPRWREFELTYRVTLNDGGTPARLWLPLPHSAGDYQRALGVEVRSSTVPVRLYEDETYGAPILQTEWSSPGAEHAVEVMARVATRDRAHDPTGRTNFGGRGDPRELALYLKPTPSMPLDGIVGETARKITAGATRPIDKARAIYEWIVDNTFRDSKTRGCGIGDIRFMLETGNLGGKCADINSLYVGLARAVGMPAREIFGIRVAPSNVTKSLGASGTISKAQHCRAEVHIAHVGWLAVDPADVRKVVLEENVTIDHPHAQAMRRRLFGNWEMNWVGFNYGRDFSLRVPAVGTRTKEPLGFFMYPHAETPEGPRDHLDPDTFRYQITAREITA